MLQRVHARTKPPTTMGGREEDRSRNSIRTEVLQEPMELEEPPEETVEEELREEEREGPEAALPEEMELVQAAITPRDPDVLLAHLRFQ